MFKMLKSIAGLRVTNPATPNTCETMFSLNAAVSVVNQPTLLAITPTMVFGGESFASDALVE